MVMHVHNGGIRQGVWPNARVGFLGRRLPGRTVMVASLEVRQGACVPTAGTGQGRTGAGVCWCQQQRDCRGGVRGGRRRQHRGAGHHVAASRVLHWPADALPGRSARRLACPLSAAQQTHGHSLKCTPVVALPQATVTAMSTLPGGWLLVAGDEHGGLSCTDLRMLGSPTGEAAAGRPGQRAPAPSWCLNANCPYLQALVFCGACGLHGRRSTPS